MKINDGLYFCTRSVREIISVFSSLLLETTVAIRIWTLNRYKLKQYNFLNKNPRENVPLFKFLGQTQIPRTLSYRNEIQIESVLIQK